MSPDQISSIPTPEHEGNRPSELASLLGGAGFSAEEVKQVEELLKDNPHFFDPLDDEEAELMAEVEKSDFPMYANPEGVKRMRQIAHNTTSKRKSISIRVLEHDLSRIKARAVEEGVPYQTLIGSILHRYANRELTMR